MLLYYSLTSSICFRLQLYSHRFHRPIGVMIHLNPHTMVPCMVQIFKYLDSQSELYTKYSLEYWDTPLKYVPPLLHYAYNKIIIF